MRNPGIADLQFGTAGDERNQPGWHSLGCLPHYCAEGPIQHIEENPGGLWTYFF